MVSGSTLFMLLSYALMVYAFSRPQRRTFHISVMSAMMVLDVFFPVYLFVTRFDNLVRQLIDEGEILSFMVWMHLIIVILLYVLYAFQIRAGWRLKQGDPSARGEHRSQGKAILVTRALVILTSMMLVDAPDVQG